MFRCILICTFIGTCLHINEMGGFDFIWYAGSSPNTESVVEYEKDDGGCETAADTIAGLISFAEEPDLNIDHCDTYGSN